MSRGPFQPSPVCDAVTAVPTIALTQALLFSVRSVQGGQQSLPGVRWEVSAGSALSIGEGSAEKAFEANSHSWDVPSALWFFSRKQGVLPLWPRSIHIPRFLLQQE